jgi:cysteine sulfinate desulfinase/cysteine desulfurase-like protein
MQIYLDYSATTPPRPEVIATMQDVLTQQWGNPSSLHEWGQRAATVVEQARMQVAGLINAPAESIIFTSGGTEANNLAIMGVARTYRKPQHMIISSVEHSAVAEPVGLLEQWGWEVTRLPVDTYGRVNPRDLENACNPIRCWFPSSTVKAKSARYNRYILSVKSRAKRVSVSHRCGSSGWTLSDRCQGTAGGFIIHVEP